MTNQEFIGAMAVKSPKTKGLGMFAALAWFLKSLVFLKMSSQFSSVLSAVPSQDFLSCGCHVHSPQAFQYQNTNVTKTSGTKAKVNFPGITIEDENHVLSLVVNSVDQFCKLY